MYAQSRLTDEIYTDENLLGTWAAFDSLPNFTERASQFWRYLTQQVTKWKMAGAAGLEADSTHAPKLASLRKHLLHKHLQQVEFSASEQHHAASTGRPVMQCHAIQPEDCAPVRCCPAC